MNKKRSVTRDIEFLYEMGSLRFVDRTWQQFFRQKVANDAEHTFRVIWIALIIARHEGVKNEEKIIKMALLHDIGETRCPDTNYISKIYSTRDEEHAIKDMLDETAISGDLLELFQEYEKRETIEAKIVKDADHLDVDFEIQEMKAKGNALGEEWSEIRHKERLFTKTAKQILNELHEVKPHMWHYNAYINHKK